MLVAFLEDSTWNQGELARRVGVERRTLVRVLKELEPEVPLDRDDDPPQVFWSVPANWFPGAVAFQDQNLLDLVRLLNRLPPSATQLDLLRRIAKCAPSVERAIGAESVLARPLSVKAENQLFTLQSSIEQRSAVRIQYFIGAHGERTQLSVHCIAFENRLLIATCHREGRLKWFRLDGILSADVDSNEPYRPADEATVIAFASQSVDGQHSGEPVVRSVFRVRLPEAEWLRDRLPFADTSAKEDAILFTAHTSGLTTLARLIVGLGNAVSIETPELRLAAFQLARAALDGHG